MTREEAIECLSERVSIGGTGDQNCMVVFGVNTDTLDEAFDMAISAIRQQDHFREVTKKVEPLTLDELWKMYDGEEGPVWVKFGTSRRSWPAILDTYDGELVAVFSATTDFLHENDYGKTWLAYRQKPTEEADK